MSCPQMVMGGQQRNTCTRTYGINIFAPRSLIQISSSSVSEKRLFFPSYSLINSPRNARYSDLMQIENAFTDPEDRFWRKTAQRVSKEILKYSRTPLFQTRLIRSPRYFEVIFPYTLNQPRYFKLVNNRAQKETPKQPTKSEVHQAIKTLSHYGLFALEGAEIQGQTSQLSFDKSIRKKPEATERSKIFQFNSIC